MPGIYIRKTVAERSKHFIIRPSALGMSDSVIKPQQMVKDPRKR